MEVPQDADSNANSAAGTQPPVVVVLFLRIGLVISSGSCVAEIQNQVEGNEHLIRIPMPSSASFHTEQPE